MTDTSTQKSQQKQGDLVRCSECGHFKYFNNSRGHNSPHALGHCHSQSWDANRGQWAMFQHPCKNFVKIENQDQE